ncbi:MAG: hypothetical protein E6L00_00490 [Thaumarchaeota archaeon]|nr:MAG: hypothetical protein E6L00_00490 [Nitrososphaerota archaeon]
MVLNDYQKKLIQVLEDNPDINTRKFIKLARLGKTTFYEYSQGLEEAGYISYNKVKNQRVWYRTRRNEKHDLGLSDFEESQRLVEKYKKIESKVLKSLQKVRKENISEKIDVYSNAIVLISATLGSMKLISIYRHKRVPNSYLQYIKKLERLLEKISDGKFFSHYGLGVVATDDIAYNAERMLDKFLGIDPDEGKKRSIY